LAGRNEAEAAPNVPERVGPYEVLLPIAAGGMATVYLARARESGDLTHQVAIKVTHSHLRTAENFATEMMEEAELAARICHPNVVAVTDVGDDPHGIYLAMEYVEGDTLSGLIRYSKRQRERVPPAVGMRILIDALMGLHAAHELTDDAGRSIGLVHRDFSPQNILVGRNGVSKLADFGVAKAATRLGNTRTGLVKGKIRYMSPEQARSMEIDRRCDIWAAGIVAWELFTGARLYDNMNDTGMLLQLVERPPPSILSIKPKTPVVIADVVTRALTMDPAGRYATAADMAAALDAAARASVGVADPATVGTFVDEAYGRTLTKRRSRATEILRLRAEMGRLAGAAQQEHPSHTGSRAVAAPSSAQKGSGIRPREELLGGEPVATPLPAPPPPIRAPMLTTPMHVFDDEATVVESSPPPATPELTPPEASPAPAEPAPSAATTTAPVPSASAAASAPTKTRPKKWPLWMSAVVAAAVGIGGAFALHSMQSESATDPSPPTVEGRPSEGQPAAGPKESVAQPVRRAVAAPANSAAPETPPPSEPEAAAEARNVSIESKVPFVRLQVDVRTVPLDQPETQIDFLLTEEERARVVRIVATALDGRRTSVKLAPGENEVHLNFPRPSRGGSPDPGDAAPLASSPYER